MAAKRQDGGSGGKLASGFPPERAPAKEKPGSLATKATRPERAKNPRKTAKPAAAPQATAKPAGKKAGVKPVASSKKAAVKPETPAKKPAAKRDPSKGPVVKTRVVIPMEVYELHKDAIKAPFREHEMKWNFLGEGRGLYKRLDNGVHCFTQFKDDGVHYSVWGDDAKRRDAILATWRRLLGEGGWAKATASGEAAGKAEAAQVESEALKLWKMQEPQPRPGEPDFFLKKRRDEWLAKRPTG